MTSAWALLRKDILRTYQYMDGPRFMKIIGCSRTPGVQAVAIYRFGQWCRAQHVVFRLVLDPIYLVFNELLKIVWGIDLPRSARIGPGLYIGHFGGIIISPTVVIGANCNISQGITIGVSGVGERRGVPTMGNNVYIAPGARVFGKISIGHNVKIGANAVVYADIPDNSVVGLSPGFVIFSVNAPDDTTTAIQH